MDALQPADAGGLAGAVARSLLLAAATAAAALTARGGGDGAQERQRGQLAAPWLDPDGDYPVVGSLAVDPAGGGL